MVSRCDNYLIIKRTIGSCYTFKCQINEERFTDAIAALIVIVKTNPNVSFSSFNAEKMFYFSPKQDYLYWDTVVIKFKIL